MKSKLTKFDKFIYMLAVAVMIFAVLDWTFCPPCQLCIGTQTGQVCIEKLDPAPEPFFVDRVKG